MKFPKASSGVKKIYTGALLSLISAIAAIVLTIMAIVALVAGANGNANAADGALIATGVLTVAVGVILLVGAILNLVGIIQASKDEASFKTALFCLILGVISSAIASFFPDNSVLVGVLTSLQRVFELAVTVFVIQGVVRLADQLNRGDVSSKGSSLLKFMLIIYVLIIIATIVSAIFGGYTVSLISAILLICAGILQIIQYFMYLNFLSNAKKMLKEN